MIRMYWIKENPSIICDQCKNSTVWSMWCLGRQQLYYTTYVCHMSFPSHWFFFNLLQNTIIIPSSCDPPWWKSQFYHPPSIHHDPAMTQLWSLHVYICMCPCVWWHILCCSDACGETDLCIFWYFVIAYLISPESDSSHDRNFAVSVSTLL